MRSEKYRCCEECKRVIEKYKGVADIMEGSV